jgi:hypothetical protein
MDNFHSPGISVSEDYLRTQEQGELLILLDSSISPVVKSITLKYDEIKSLQDLLNILFNYLLATKVSPYSYGIEWILAKYDGKAFKKLTKAQTLDMRTLPVAGLVKNDILHIRRL